MTHTVLITGGAQRIGKALAQSFAKAGWSVAIHYNHSQDEACALVESLKEMGVKACAVQGDLAEESEVIALFPKIHEKLGMVHLLINNASIFEFDTVPTASRHSWDQHMEINLRAPFVLSQQFIQQTATGVIINIIDARVKCLSPNYTSYLLSKAGLWTLTQTMALSLAPHIRVNAIGPGYVLGREGHSPDRFEELCGTMPLIHQVDVDDICRAAHFIWDTKSMTGDMITVDSGLHLGWTFPQTILSR